MRSDEQTMYRIRVHGHLGRHASTWFPAMEIVAQEDGTSLLTGPVGDQAALHALLRKIRDLGLPLIEVAEADSTPPRSQDPRS